MQERNCSVCKQNKDESLFYRSKTAKSGYRSECKECHLRKVKSYYDSHQSKCLEYSKQYYLENSEAIAAKRKKKYKEKKDANVE
jgi:hypothetical protein